MNNDDRAKLEALPAFDDPHVQIVYRILCDTDLVPPPDEHWEGFTARHVVAALASAQAASAEPVAPIEASELEDMARIACEEALAFGIGLDSFHRLAKSVMKRCATPAPAVAPAAVTDERAFDTELYGALQQACLALEELNGPGYLIGGVMHHRIGLILPKLKEQIAALAARTPEPQAERHLSKAEQGALRRALMRSAKFVDQEPQPDSRGQAREGFQRRVEPWLLACFGEEIAADRTERSHRFIEEALELVQACGTTASEAHQLVDYVYGRPVGEAHQEVGGVMVTLAALCRAHALDMHEAGETELARIWTKVEQIRAKQAAKPKHSPLPAAASPTPDEQRAQAAQEDVIQRLRSAPNWRRESFGHWKDCTLVYDRAPFDAADEIERLRALISDRNEAIELLRRAFCALPRYSFLLDDSGGVRRVPDFSGNWVEFQKAHELFEGEVVDALSAKKVTEDALRTALAGRQTL